MRRGIWGLRDGLLLTLGISQSTIGSNVSGSSTGDRSEDIVARDGTAGADVWVDNVEMCQLINYNKGPSFTFKKNVFHLIAQFLSLFCTEQERFSMATGGFNDCGHFKQPYFSIDITHKNSMSDIVMSRPFNCYSKMKFRR